MATATRNRRVVPGVDLPVLAATVVLIALEVWFLTTQTQSMLLPLLWMAPMDLLLLAYALDESLRFVEIVMMLFFGRFLLFPVIFLSNTNSFLLFYGLFMAPVDVIFAGYVLRSAGRTFFGSTPT